MAGKKKKGLQFDPEVAVAHLENADPTLGKLIARCGPFAMQTRDMMEPFYVLLRTIVYQQLSGKAADSILRRVLLVLGTDPPTPASVRMAEDQALRDAGLSWAKIKSIKDLAEHTDRGTIPDLKTLYRLDNEEIIERLTAVRGIGRWSVEMLLMFQLGRADILPITDLGVRKGYMMTYDLESMPTPKELEKLCEHWRPYRTVASWYLWRAVDGEAAL